MPRTMTSAMQTAIAAGEIYPAIFMDATFRSGPAHFWTGFGPYAWNGNTYTGIGVLAGITPIEEGSTVSARNVTLTLSGVYSALLSDVLSEFQVNAPVVLNLGMFAAGSLIADPVIMWAGRMDQPVIDSAGETALISITCENRLIGLNVVQARRYTNDDQQLDHPGDTAFSMVQSIQECTIYFGATPNSTNNL